MGKIKLLDESTINKIAAGEVIERPMSVVKELVENSLDANADEIIIKLKDGGKKQISVIDNGEGMTKDDLLICTKKHATSKIKTIDDIYNIFSYGFRGEALATIAEVSKMEIISATLDSEVSYKITLEEGKIKEISEDAKRKGTTINVYNLFYTIPARQKFLKSSGYELKRIVDYLKSLAIANPKVSFKIYHDNKLIYYFSKKNTYEERIKEIFGLELMNNDYEDPVVKLKIFFSDPRFVSDSGIQLFYVNNRPIKNDIVKKAIYKAYLSKIPKGKKPHVFAFFNISPKVVDVNVHPQKLEVRVKNENLFYFPVYEAIVKGLEEKNEKIDSSELISLINKRLVKSSQNLKPVEEIKAVTENSNIPQQKLPVISEQRKIYLNDVASKVQENAKKFKYKLIGQIFDTYIVIEKDNEVYFIDQHVAEERYNFEKLKDYYLNKKEINKQKLLLPIILDLDPSLLKIIEEKKTLFEKIGFDLDIFGNDQIIIRQIPIIMEQIPSKDELLELIKNLSLDFNNFTDNLDSIFATMACKASIKADTPLSEPIMRKIVDNLFSTKNPYTCPHGRPIFFVLTRKDFDKRVKRI